MGDYVSYEEAILRQAAAIPLATTRSGATFRDIAAANIARNPIRILRARSQMVRICTCMFHKGWNVTTNQTEYYI
jgi:hypothetical protein